LFIGVSWEGRVFLVLLSIHVGPSMFLKQYCQKTDCPGLALSVLATGSSKIVQIGKLGTSRRYLYILVFLAAKDLD
jgi:hypothetical protein